MRSCPAWSSEPIELCTVEAKPQSAVSDNNFDGRYGSGGMAQYAARAEPWEGLYDLYWLSSSFGS
jgi:hypothetical protein